MDPNACLEAADQALSDGDLDECFTRIGNYWFWRYRGGFEPRDVASSGKAGDVFADWLENRAMDYKIA